MNNRASSNRVLDWLQERRESCELRFERLPLNELDGWRFERGTLAHRTGGFFAMAGIDAEVRIHDSAHRVTQPIILQPEVGILGFLCRRAGDRTELLLQAKAEPGNIGGVQLAPSVQATESNYLRRHGGRETLFLEYFQNGMAGRYLCDIKQSEQGTRFLGKYNRNVLVEVESTPLRVPDDWLWCDSLDVLQLLREDYAVNTDSRSVLVCSDWGLFCPGGIPFGKHRGQGGFGEALLDSLESDVESGEPGLQTAISSLDSWREQVSISTTRRPLERVPGWSLTRVGLLDESRTQFDVLGFSVHCARREVPHWHQPLVANCKEGLVVLLCQRQNGRLRFLLRGSLEVGFKEGLQLGPSVHTTHGEGVTASVSGGLEHEWHTEQLLAFLAATPDLADHAIVRQSEEGGRFFNCSTTYRIAEAPEGAEIPTGSWSCWVSLSQIRALLQLPGALSNEARSALSILLSWL